MIPVDKGRVMRKSDSKIQMCRQDRSGQEAMAKLMRVTGHNREEKIKVIVRPGERA